MKRKVDNSSAVTKEDIDRLEEHLSRIDTSIALTQKLSRLEILSSASETQRRLERLIKDFKSENFTRLDGIVKELEDLREDKVIGISQTKELKKKAEEHEKRINKLESQRLAA